MKAEMEEIKPNKIFIAAKSRSQIKCWTGGHLCNIILMLLSILSSYNTNFILKFFSITGRRLHQHLPAVDISLPNQIHVLLFMFCLLYEIEITSRYAFISLPAWWRGVTDSTLHKMSQTRWGANQDRGRDVPHPVPAAVGRVARGTLPAEAGPAPELPDPHPDGLREPLPGWEHGDPGGPWQQPDWETSSPMSDRCRVKSKPTISTTFNKTTFNAWVSLQFR